MIKKTLQYAWSVRFEFTKYFIIGVSGVVLDMATLIFLKEVLGWLPIFAVIINQALMLVYIFYLNKYWTFRNKEIPHKQVVRFLTLAGFNYLLSVVIMYVLNHNLGFDYRLVRLGSIVVMVSWNFFLYKYWVYQT